MTLLLFCCCIFLSIDSIAFSMESFSLLQLRFTSNSQPYGANVNLSSNVRGMPGRGGGGGRAFLDLTDMLIKYIGGEMALAVSKNLPYLLTFLALFSRKTLILKYETSFKRSSFPKILYCIFTIIRIVLIVLLQI